MFATNIKVIVIDDMMMARMLVKKTLSEMGFTNIVEAKDGKEGWEHLTVTTPDIGLIISDWNMPNMTGIQLLRAVRAEKKIKTLPFIMITAEGEETQIKEAFQSGVDGYITKPFNPEIFKAKMEYCHRKIINSSQAA